MLTSIFTSTSSDLDCLSSLFVVMLSLFLAKHPCFSDLKYREPSSKALPPQADRQDDKAAQITRSTITRFFLTAFLSYLIFSKTTECFLTEISRPVERLKYLFPVNSRFFVLSRTYLLQEDISPGLPVKLSL